MNSVIIIFSNLGNYVPKLMDMTEWCEDNAGIQYADWHWDWAPSPDYTCLTAKFKFERHQVATMFRLKFYNE